MVKILASELKDKLEALMGKKQKPSPATDDFDWKVYHNEYRDQLQEIHKEHTQVLAEGDYILEDGRLTPHKKMLPLHPNHHLLYETIVSLKPSSVMEMGCGGGDHLWNLQLLAPEIALHGSDLSCEQIHFAKKRHPSLNAAIRKIDLTLPLSYDVLNVDVVYTQAVIMHIQLGNSHLVALSNLFKTATKQVILVENWKRHPFMQDITYLFSCDMIPWENIHFYYNQSWQNPETRLMIISSTPLAGYEKLTDYTLLQK